VDDGSAIPDDRSTSFFLGAIRTASAWDVGIFTGGGGYIDKLAADGKMTSSAVTSEYKKLGPVGRNLGLFWGGDWSKPDRPHYQMLDNDELGAVRQRFFAGQPIL